MEAASLVTARLLDDQVVAGLHAEFAATDDLADLAQLIRGFLERAEEQVAVLLAAARRGDLQAVAATGHQLAGGSRTFGAALLGSIAAEAEDAAAAGDADRLVRTVRSLKPALARTRSALG